MKPFALLDRADENRARLYQDWQCSDYLAAAELDTVDACLARGWAQGWHACLLLPYDFGRDVMGVAQTGAMMEIAWYRSLVHLDDVAAWLAVRLTDAPAGVIAAELECSAAAFATRIAAIHDYIRAGESYQVNYTTRCRGQIYGHPLQLYRHLRYVQPAPYAACIYHGATRWTLSLSPERFLSINGRDVVSEPMKGTAPLCGDGQDQQRAIELAMDTKNRAENAMIVDLMRNDLGKVAQFCSVEVVRPFQVKAHGKVWQMTSEVRARLRDDVGYAELIRATFPCGSITGAPKYRTMQLIDELEDSPRGLYTGSIGYVDADGKGCLNIAIRTLEIDGAEYTLGVGAGITIDSSAAGEYAECQWKKAFLHHPVQPFTLFETMLVEDGRVAWLDNHLARLCRSAADLGFVCPQDAIRSAVVRYIAALRGVQRLKVTLQQDGQFDFSSGACARLDDAQSALIYAHTLPVHDPLRRYKTSQRALYDQAWRYAEAQGAFDALVFNHDGVLLEGGRSSVFIRVDGIWQTPALDLDILPGILRRQVLDDPQSWLGSTQIQENHITRAQLARADVVMLGNALRGLFAVRLRCA